MVLFSLFLLFFILFSLSFYLLLLFVFVLFIIFEWVGGNIFYMWEGRVKNKELEINGRKV